MKKIVNGLDAIKAKIDSLVGKDISIEVTRGRKRMDVNGKVESTYKSVFVIEENKFKRKLSYSYSDVLCGNVKII